MNSLKILRDKLTDNELKYVKMYIKTGNQLKSYKSTFPNEQYPKKHANGFHRHAGIRDYLAEWRDNMAEKTTVDKQWVINRLKENSDLGSKGWDASETKTDADGGTTHTSKRKMDLSSSNRASELLGKNLGMFTNEININGIDELVKGLMDKGDDIASQVDTEAD